MQLRTTLVLARREYLSRVTTKGFWIGTLTVPFLMAALFAVPSMVLSRTSSDHRTVLVDGTGQLADGIAHRLTEAPQRARRGLTRFQVQTEPIADDTEAQQKALDQRVLQEEIDSWIWIDPQSLETPRVVYHGESVSNFFTQSALERAISAEMRRARVAAAGLDPDLVEKLSSSVSLETVRVTSEGGQQETGEAGFWFAYIMFFVLYMVILIWGQQVLNGVLEEKSSRIVEVVLSPARPVELMVGKLAGIGGAGLTQLGIWLACAVVATAPALIQTLAFLPPEVTIPTLGPGLAALFCLYFVLGFFIFASLYAAIGSAFNNLQEAQQVATVVVIFVVAPMFVIFPVINDPDSLLATVSSLIPLFTPMLMPVRMAVKMPPVWQILLSVVLTSGFLVFLLWLCGRIYRVGILMYGKKPTFQEIWKWLRYA